MRMFPAGLLPLKSRTGGPVRLTHKGRPAARVTHLSAPLKGLSRFAELNEINPQYASDLTNWIVEKDRITVRPGYTLFGSIPTGHPISSLVPYSSDVSKFVAAADGKLYSTSGTVLSSGYGSDYWAWSMFSNLSAVDYTVMVNGADGVVSWDGTNFVKETVTAPAGEPWLLVNRLDKIYAHMNRLWFADSDNMAVYYLPVQQKSGTLFLFPLNAIFRRGGHIVAIHSWSVDGGAGMDDGLVIFTSNGECAIYQGVDPASDFALVGVFRFDSPMSKTSVINFGGDLYILISTGFVPLTTLIRAETENLGKSDLNVMNEFEAIAKGHRDDYGWSVILNSHTNHAICNMPLGNGKYQQMVRMMPDQVWAKWSSLPSRCWLWFDNHTYFGSEDGKIYLGGNEYFNDNGASIRASVRFAWSSYRTPAKKNFTMVRVYTITDGQPSPYIDMEVDYNELLFPVNRPEVSTGPSGGAKWNTATWDVDDWAATASPKPNWQGVTGLGRVGAPHIHVDVTGCVFSITGIDVLYETGGWL